jgi:hypothetical protein
LGGSIADAAEVDLHVFPGEPVTLFGLKYFSAVKAFEFAVTGF